MFTLNTHFYRYIVLIVFLPFFLISCSDLSAPPIDTTPKGLSGQIMDVEGNPIDEAKIFCLYYLTYIPAEPVQALKINRSSTQDGSFDFRLFQNFPNPFSNSSFLRFSLPQECTVFLRIRTKNSATTVYQYTDILPYGLYQRYLENLVDSLNLKNCLYRYSLQAQGVNGTSYFSQKDLLIVSNLGSPNAISNDRGEYFFDYGQAFVGDSVMVTQNDIMDNMYKVILDNQVNLLIEKETYISKIITVELYPDVLVNQDIVLLKENML
jgi:hypothetical protein